MTATDQLFAILATAASNTPLSSALHHHTVDVLLDATGHDLIQVVHRTHGVVGARWAITCATALEQRNDLYVQLTPAGRNRFGGAR